MHRKIDDPTELLMYERYTNREAWDVTHNSKPYIKELVPKLPDYLASDLEIVEYELIG
ncbi:putative quinol monooxygenase [Chloroflexota bacterium]